MKFAPPFTFWTCLSVQVILGCSLAGGDQLSAPDSSSDNSYSNNSTKSERIFISLPFHKPPTYDIARAGSYRPCTRDEDCSTNQQEYCNKQYTELIVPPCSKGFCQCEKGYAYDRHYESCKNVCATYKIGDVCGIYPTRLLPDGAICNNNIVTCKSGVYCPAIENVRKKAYGEECSETADCNHYSLACLPLVAEKTSRRRPKKLTCQCNSLDYTYDPLIGRCRRYSLSDSCEGYCGEKALHYRTGLRCSPRGVCVCAKSHPQIVPITVPSVRIGVPDSEAYLEVFDTITVCVVEDAMINRKPSSDCNIRHMTALCEKGSFCLPCIHGCPLPICRALRSNPSNDNKTLSSIPTVEDDPFCQGSGIFGSFVGAASFLTSNISRFNVFLLVLAIYKILSS